MKKITLDIRAFFYVLIACQLALGIASVPLISVTWDEPVHFVQVTEQINFAIAVIRDPSSRPNFENIYSNLEFYGSLSLLPAYFLSWLLDVLAPGYGTRFINYSIILHSMTILIGILCPFLAVAIVYHERKSHFHAYLAGCLLATAPIWMGSAYFNYKDVPIAAAVLVCLYGFQLYRANPSPRNSLVFMLGIALLGSQRLAACGLVAPLLIGFAIASYQLKDKTDWLKTIGLGFLALTVVFVLTPPAWVEPIRFMTENINHMADHIWDACTLTRGGCLGPASDAPWSAGHYLAEWWSVQTPLGIAILAAFAIPLGLRRCFEKGLPSIVLLASWLWPLVALTLFNSVLYDGIRHVLLVFPLFVVWACAYAPAEIERVRFALYAYCVFLTIDAVKLFPYQNTWLNEGARLWANEETHQMDYWGISLKEASNLGAETWPHLRMIDFPLRQTAKYIVGDSLRTRDQIGQGAEYMRVSPIRTPNFKLPDECTDIAYVTRQTLFAPAPIKFSYAARCIKR
jgi:hypothetical protein